MDFNQAFKCDPMFVGAKIGAKTFAEVSPQQKKKKKDPPHWRR